MFENRDLTLLGAGALGAVLVLLLPLPFAARIVSGFLVLGAFMLAALLRLGPDRIPLEAWLGRRLRFALERRRFTYLRAGWEQPASYPPAPAPEARPLALALEEVGLYPLASALLSVVAAYTLAWLGRGGALEVARSLGLILGK
jgi:hypothetical protein